MTPPLGSRVRLTSSRTRAVLLAVASVGVHWGALHAVVRESASSDTHVVVVRAASERIVVHLHGDTSPAGPTAARVVTPLRPRQAVRPEGQRARDSTAGRPLESPRDASSATGGTVMIRGGSSHAVAPVIDATASGTPATRVTYPSATVGDGPRYLEAWEVDAPAQFLVAPASLDELPALAGGALELVVSIRSDSDGALAGVDVESARDARAVPAAVSQAIREAFAAVSFLPATRDGRAVPAVQRWHVALDVNAPIEAGFRVLN